MSSVQWGKSTANNRSHGKIVLAISSILRTHELLDLGIVLLRFEYFNVIDVCFCSLCARMMSWHARAMFRESIVFLVGRYGKIITCGLSSQNPKLAELWNGIGSSPAKHKISLNFDQLQSKYSLPFG